MGAVSSRPVVSPSLLNQQEYNNEDYNNNNNNNNNNHNNNVSNRTPNRRNSQRVVEREVEGGGGGGGGGGGVGAEDDNNPADAHVFTPSRLFSAFLPFSTASLYYSTPATLNSQPYPKLTQEQLRTLLSNGLSLDLAFVPYQMPRLISSSLNKESSKEKHTVRMKIPMFLHKNSISFKPQLNKQESQLKFSFDTLISCNVTVYRGVKEKRGEKGIDHRYTSPPHLPPYTISFPIGSNHQFLLPLSHSFQLAPIHSSSTNETSTSTSTSVNRPTNGISSSNSTSASTSASSASASSASVTSSSHSSSPSTSISLTETSSLPSINPHANPAQNYFPIIIRFSNINSTLIPVSHSISSNSLPSSETLCISSLTVYLSFVKDPSNAMAPNLLSQKLRVNEREYEIQEIYGQPTHPSISSSLNENNAATPPVENVECVVCLNLPRSHLIFPCRHFCLCEVCTKIYREENKTQCPVCRGAISAIVKINPTTRNSNSNSIGERQENEVKVEVRDI